MNKLLEARTIKPSAFWETSRNKVYQVEKSRPEQTKVFPRVESREERVDGDQSVRGKGFESSVGPSL